MEQATEKRARVDLHLHSRASNVTDYYAANMLSLPESYSDPFELYHRLKDQGLALVTLTDHNSIDGGRALLEKGLPDVFLSSELTVRFPDDGCRIHITIVNCTEAQFAESNRLRRNIFELVDYLEGQVAAETANGNRLAWFMTHPLTSTENRVHGREGALNLGHLERAALLLPGFEIRNGARSPALNGLCERWVGSLTPDRLAGWAQRHRMAPRGRAPWGKFVVGGSDDHSGLNPGRTWTTFPFTGDRATPNDLVLAMRAGCTQVEGAHGGPLTLSHALMKLVYDRHRQPPDAVRPAFRRSAQPVLPSTVGALLQVVFQGGNISLLNRVQLGLRLWWQRMSRRALPTIGVPFERVLDQECCALLDTPGFVASLKAPDLSVDERIFRVVDALLQRIFRRYVDVLARAPDRDMLSVLKELISVVAGQALVSLPYFTAFSQQSLDAMVARDIAASLGESRQKLALFTDTFFEINGVSNTIRRMLRESVRRDIDFTVVTCVSASDRERLLQNEETRRFVESGRLQLFASTTELDFPEYEGLKLRFPPLLSMLRFLQEGGYTKVQVSTPGTIGLAGLAIAKLLKLETAATYHTSFPEYVENYTRDMSLEELAWKLMLAFYQSVDEVLVPSKYIARLLHRRGLRNRKLLILDRWVDVERFHPRRRDPLYWRQRGLDEVPGSVRFLYLGRLGVEKNIALLAEAFRLLHARRQEARLVVVGDGPYRNSFKSQLAGLPVHFAGFVEGDDLPRAVASCDVKVFPSLTDTWGNAPLEAQSCGLPVIVSEVGGPPELMVEGVTGLKVRGHDAVELADAMEALMDPARRARMSEAAREFCVEHRVDEPFMAVLDSDGYRRRAEERKRRSGEVRSAVNLQVLDMTSAQFEAQLGVTGALITVAP